MSDSSPIHLFFAALAGLIAGGINSVAGGGSMISFPVLLALGISPIIANATNTVGIWPGAIGSLWGFRNEFRRVPKSYHWLLLPAVIGSSFGAYLLRHTSAEFFERMVPGLILFATIMFIIAPLIRERLNRKANTAVPQSHGKFKIAIVVILQLSVSIYGGYFGAGMSILMLSILSIMGMTDMLVMTAMTSFLSLAINGVAGVIFAFSGLIHWPIALVMMIAAIAGGYGAAGIARKIGGVWIRRFVIAVGLTLAIVMLVRIL